MVYLFWIVLGLLTVTSVVLAFKIKNINKTLNSFIAYTLVLFTGIPGSSKATIIHPAKPTKKTDPKLN